MASYTLKRFARLQTLRSIKPSNLHRFLMPYDGYFSARGFSLGLAYEHPFPGDYKALVSILGYPNADTPQQLIDALYHVDEMSTPAGMEVLTAEFSNAGYRFDDLEPTPADIAVLAWITDSDLFEKVYAKQAELSLRTFRVYAPEEIGKIEHAFNDSGLSALEDELNDWSETNKLGRHCKVFLLPGDGERCYIVRRGQPYSRVCAISKGRSSSIVFQPETFDIVICDFLEDELHISAGTKVVRDLYRRLFGRHLFGSERCFSDQPVYTLSPLAIKGRKSLCCDDIPGVKDVKLRKVQVNVGGGLKQSVTWKGADVYQNPEFVRRVSDDSDISMASFAIKFESSARSRSTEVRPPNVLRYRRDGDVRSIGHLLRSRGFVIRANRGRYD